jgi:hypothetical protein
MLDVHPPHEAAHTWKDFFLHIATIVVGLLIAIGLEQTVELLHRRHLLHTAEANLRSELHDNQALLTSDERYLNITEQQIEAGLRILADVKAHKPVVDEPSQHWEWDSPQAAAWDTARNTGAISLMSYDDAESYALVYDQQTIVNTQATLFIRDIYSISAPLHGDLKLTDLSPAAIDTMVANSNQTLSDIRLLRDYCGSLDRIYGRAAKL